MEYLTVSEFANRTKLCCHTIRASIKAGKIYACRPGPGKRSPFRIPVTELERLQIAYQFENKVEE
jgi:excisionase family DNA binding protein